MSLANDLLQQYEPEIERITLVPSQGGVFEVQVNESLLFSKLQSGRHANPGEVLTLIDQLLKKH